MMQRLTHTAFRGKDAARIVSVQTSMTNDANVD